MTHLHQLVLAASEEDVVAVVIPFVLTGRAAGEPTLLSVAPPTAAAVRAGLGPRAGPTAWLIESGRRRPATDLERFAGLVRDRMAGGTPVRVVHEIPEVLYRNWHEWRRYEAMVNVARAGLDAWGLCVYDERELTRGMVEDLRSTHPYIGPGVDRRVNPDYQEPRAFCDKHFDAPADPVERTHPALELLDPTPAAARAAVRDLVDGRALLTGDDIEGLVLATHEAVTNAVTHGRPPVHLRGWVTPDRVIVTVADTGSGPQDPFLGLLHTSDRLGMWLSHQLVEVAHRRHAGGYTVRMTATASESVA